MEAEFGHQQSLLLCRRHVSEGIRALPAIVSKSQVYTVLGSDVGGPLETAHWKIINRWTLHRQIWIFQLTTDVVHLDFPPLALALGWEGQSGHGGDTVMLAQAPRPPSLRGQYLAYKQIIMDWSRNSKSLKRKQQLKVKFVMNLIIFNGIFPLPEFSSSLLTPWS